MAERLIRILAFVNVADGASVALPHGINVAGTPTAPDLLAFDTGGFSATADVTNVTVTNNSGGVASVNVWAQLVHSVPREIGAIPLVPSPFVVAAGGGGGGGSAWLTVEPTVQTAPFIAAAGMLYLLGDPGKFGGITLPSAASMPANQAIGFKVVFDTQNWVISPGAGDTIEQQPTGWETSPNMAGGGCLAAWIVLTSDGVSNWSVVSTNRTLQILHNSVNADTVQGRPFGQIDFLGAIQAQGISAGRCQVSIDWQQARRTLTNHGNTGVDIVPVIGDVNYVQASAPINAPLPQISTLTIPTGNIITFYLDQGSLGAVTITPGGIDTINGAASYVLTTAIGSVTLVSDGIHGNWMVTSVGS